MFFFPRFIFVNYNAWQYAGCEVLWAGIVKALAEKVEAEFGIFTTRLFRSINLETVVMPEREDSHNQQQLFLEFLSEVYPYEDISSKMGLYGTHSLKTLQQWKAEDNSISLEVDNEKNYRVVKFDKSEDAKKAFEAMQNVQDVKASFSLPAYDKSHAQACKNNSNRLRNPKSNDLELWWDKWRWNNIAIVVGIIIAIGSSIAFSVLSFLPNVYEVRKYSLEM